MSYTLSGNQYGKAEIHIVRIYRDTPRHEIRDITVTTALQGDFADAYLTGDQHEVLPTDTQKNTAFVWAKTHGDGAVEDYALALARHFVDDVEPVHRAQVDVLVDAWQRAVVDGAEHDHTWVKKGPENRTVRVVVEGEGDAPSVTVSGGVSDFVILKSTGSEFHGFLKDEYTTLEETHDRIMATSLVARWRYTSTDVEWDKTRTDVRRILIDRFADVHSLCIQRNME